MSSAISHTAGVLGITVTVVVPLASGAGVMSSRRADQRLAGTKQLPLVGGHIELNNLCAFVRGPG